MSVFVEGFEHDIFVSYAWVDQEEVTSIRASLERRLAQLLGRRDAYDLWIDTQDMNRSVELSPQIRKALDQTATMLVMLSPGYLQSPWCPEELDTFWSNLDDEHHGRVFVVHCDHVEPEDRPMQIAQFLGYEFCDYEDGVSRRWRPDSSKDEERYVKQINRLAHDISHKLKQLKSDAASISGGRESGPSRPTIFLASAQTTADVYQIRETMKTRFQQAGFEVIPDRQLYSLDPVSFQEEVETDLKSCAAFVQVLSPHWMMSAAGESYAGMQHDLATKAKMQIYQWRDPKLTADLIERDLDPQTRQQAGCREHRDLLLGTTVQAVDIADFTRNVEDAINRKIEQDRADRATGSVDTTQRYVYVNATPEDDDVIAKIRSMLQSTEISWQTRTHDGKPCELRQDFEDNVRSCDCMLVVHAAGSVPWVRGQLRDALKITKLASNGKKKSPKRLAIVQGPPRPKPDLGIGMPGLEILTRVEELQPFIDSLGNGNSQMEVRP